MHTNNRESVSKYTESFYNFFASTGINRNWLARSQNGAFQLSYIHNWRLALFLLLRVNVYAKILYLVLLYNGRVHSQVELDFFTKYGIVIWLVTTAVAIYSDFYYLSRYPCFEVLCAFWNAQSEISRLLSFESKQKFKKRLDSGARFRTTFHMVMSTISMVGLGVQYVMNSKGVIFTGSLVAEEPLILTVLLGFHEEFFLYATWAQAVSVILVQVLAYRELTVVFQVLTQEVRNLSQNRSNKIALLSQSSRKTLETTTAGKRKRKSVQENTARKTIDGKSSSSSSDSDCEWRRPSRILSRYSIHLIFIEYRKLQIVTEQMKAVTSYVLLSTIIIYFAQISSDVFVGIRLLRMNAYADVFFYAADCSCSMLYWFVSLNSLSKLDTAFEDFHDEVKRYFCSRNSFRPTAGESWGGRNTGSRKMYLKMYKSFRTIATWIGPCAMTKLTVGTVMMTLVNYYILAAMW